MLITNEVSPNILRLLKHFLASLTRPSCHLTFLSPVLRLETQELQSTAKHWGEGGGGGLSLTNICLLSRCLLTSKAVHLQKTEADWTRSLQVKSPAWRGEMSRGGGQTFSCGRLAIQSNPPSDMLTKAFEEANSSMLKQSDMCFPYLKGRGLKRKKKS